MIKVLFLDTSFRFQSFLNDAYLIIKVKGISFGCEKVRRGIWELMGVLVEDCHVWFEDESVAIIMESPFYKNTLIA